jgi:hypothetical protein
MLAKYLQCTGEIDLTGIVRVCRMMREMEFRTWQKLKEQHTVRMSEVQGL